MKKENKHQKYLKQTDEFSFVLKPAVHGIGVFATHPISRGTHLRLFGPPDEEKSVDFVRKEKDVPKLFHEHCINKEGGELLCPEDFGRQHIGWYLNHSKTPNAIHQKYLIWYATRDIEKGEEITIDYNSLDEPEDKKESYYI